MEKVPHTPLSKEFMQKFFLLKSYDKRQGFSQEYLPETSPPRHPAYHNIVQLYVRRGAHL
jgi:hypothetical protein